MGKIILRIIFKLAKKLALKALADFVEDYAKDKFEGLLDAPKLPKIKDIPDLQGDETKESNDLKDKAKEKIKDVTIERVGGLGVVALGFAGLGDNPSTSDVNDAVRDLDNTAEDWNDDILPIVITVGAGVTNVTKNLTLESSFTAPKLEFSMPEIKLPEIPEFDIKISKNFYDGDLSEEGTGETETSSESASTTKPSVGMLTGSRKRKEKESKSVASKTKGGVHHYAETSTITRADTPLDMLAQYTYNVTSHMISKEGERQTFKPDEIILHCTATSEGVEYPLSEIERWHINRDFNGIGYHFVIHLDGSIETGRPLNKMGAHCKEGGHNYHSIGIAYVGGYKYGTKIAKDTRTKAQKRSMWRLVLHLLEYFPNATVHGHREFTKTKACPCFDVQAEWKRLKAKNFNLDEFDEKPVGGVLASSETHSSTSDQYIDDTITQTVDKDVVKENDG